MEADDSQHWVTANLPTPYGQPAQSSATQSADAIQLDGEDTISRPATIPLPPVGAIIQAEEDGAIFDEEDDQRGGEIGENEHSFLSHIDFRFFKLRAIIAINDAVLTREFNYNTINSTITFHYPNKVRGTIILDFRLPRDMDIAENPSQQASYHLQLEFPSRSIDPTSLEYCSLLATAKSEELPANFRSFYGNLREQMGDDGQCNFAIVKFKATVCLPTSGRLPKLSDPTMDQAFRVLLLITSENKPLYFAGVLESSGNESLQEFARFQAHMIESIAKDPIDAWFKETPPVQILNVGNLTKPPERPEIPVQRANLVFEDKLAYQLPHAYSAAAEQEFRDRKVADYDDIPFTAKFQEMSGSKVEGGPTGAYLAYIDLGASGIDKPSAGDTIWVNLPFPSPEIGPQCENDTRSDAANTGDGQCIIPNAADADLQDDPDLAEDIYGARQEENYDHDEEDTRDKNLNCWRGQVVENALKTQGYICLIVLRRLEPKSAWKGQESNRPYVRTQVPAFDDQHTTIEAMTEALENAPSFQVTLEPDHSRQTFKDELRSLNDFLKTDHTKDLRDYLLGLSCIRNTTQTSNLLEGKRSANMHSNFTKSQRAAYESLENISHRLVLVNGPFGTGKTRFALCIAAEFQSNPDVKKRLLYVSSSNKAVDDAAARYMEMCAANNISKTIIRVHSLKGEKGMVLRNFETKKGYHTRFTNELSDTFLAQFQAAAYIKTLQDEFDQRNEKGDPRRVMNNHALSEGMLRYIDEHPEQASLQSLRRQLQQYSRDSLKKDEISALKLGIGELMALTLHDTDAVFATINNSSKYNLYNNFHADLVIIDESCRASEISTLAPITYYNAQAYIFVGDPAQMRPTLFSAEQEKYGNKIVVNPFWRQGLMSLHDRMARIGHPVCFLQEQHRCQGNISYFPSQRFYHSMVVNADTNLPETARAMQRHATTHMGLRSNRSSNVVFIAVNGKVTGLLQNSEFLKQDGSPGTITIEAFYKAQVGLFRNQILRLKPEWQSRVQVRTVDSMQGFEDDVVIVDTVNSRRVGFVGEAHRLNVALTRSRYLLIFLYNPDILDNDDKNAARRANTREIYYLLDYAKRNQLIIDRHAPSSVCLRCGGPGHRVKDCPEPGPNLVCHNCNEQGHFAKECPHEKVLICGHCKINGHTRRYCPQRNCKKCGELGHVKDDCDSPSKIQCKQCNEFGHFKRACPFKKGLTTAKYEEIKLSQRDGSTQPSAAQPATSQQDTLDQLTLSDVQHITSITDDSLGGHTSTNTTTQAMNGKGPMGGGVEW